MVILQAAAGTSERALVGGEIVWGGSRMEDIHGYRKEEGECLARRFWRDLDRDYRRQLFFRLASKGNPSDDPNSLPGHQQALMGKAS